MYKDGSKNGQSKFAKVFNALRIAAKIESELPLGTLRNQLPDWITAMTQDAVSSSVALCYGILYFLLGIAVMLETAAV